MKITEIEEMLRAVLSSKRFIHSRGVAYTSAALAMRFHTNIDQALLAGWLHDCAKEYSDEQLMKLCEEQGIPVTEAEHQCLQLLHGKVGAYLAKTVYGIDDEAVLGAIRYHVTGKANMNMLEKIIFVADFIEPSRNQNSTPSLDIIREAAFDDLDRGVLLVTQSVLAYLENSKEPIDQNSRITYEYYEKLERERKTNG